ncbi:MAG: hypothetical protein LBS60_09090 [Deltaproteobacteria bacterium]|jgi:hypothetical protein|nr:hypothetical protein [Deltaproteobacteria bacterium]
MDIPIDNLIEAREVLAATVEYIDAIIIAATTDSPPFVFLDPPKFDRVKEMNAIIKEVLKVLE